MSRLVDRLERIGRGPVTSMGFGAASRTEKIPSMALVGTLSDPGRAAQGASTLARMGADGALIEGMHLEDITQELSDALGEVPWGIRVQDLKDDLASQFREKGCDFLAFGPDAALVEALGDEDTAYLLCIQPDMEERFLRAVEDLPVDVVLLDMKSVERPLTLQHLITVSSVRSAFSKYLLLEVPGVLTTGELEGLRDVGVDGLVVDATALSAEELQELKDRLLAVPKRQRSRSGRPSALLPRMDHTPPGAPSREDEEEEECREGSRGILQERKISWLS